MRNKIEKLSQWSRRERLGQRFLSFLLSAVLLTSSFVQMPVAVNAAEPELICNLEEHTHSAACYTSELICGLEESETHEHSDACYQDVLSCGKSNHTHTDACYSKPDPEPIVTETPAPEVTETPAPEMTETPAPEATETPAPEVTETPAPTEMPEPADEPDEDEPDEDEPDEDEPDEDELDEDLPYENEPDYSADIENKADWERSVKDARLTGEWAHDFVAVALTQRGYKESRKNFIITDGVKHGRTRYGEWAGYPYDEWNALFVSFCLNYAKIPESAMPRDIDVANWVLTLQKKSMYAEAESDYTPKAGDLIFFGSPEPDVDKPARVGIIVKISGKSARVIEGGSGRVRYRNVKLSEQIVLGFGILPQNPNYVPPIYVAKIPATCDADGVKAHYEDEESGKLWMDYARSRQATAEMLRIPGGHVWEEAVYTWAEDYSTLTAKRVCKRDAEHCEEETVAVTGEVTKEPTEEETGLMNYISDEFVNPAFKPQHVTAEIPVLSDVPDVRSQILYAKLPGKAEMSVRGELPVGTHVTAELVEKKRGPNPVENMILGYDITLSYQGEQIQPDHPVTVTVSDPAIAKAIKAGLGIEVFHLTESGLPEKVSSRAEGDTVRFDAASFSPYLIATVVLHKDIIVNGATYRVTASYDYDSGIPTSGTALLVKEIEEENPLCASFDIKIVSESEPDLVYQPAEGKSVSLSVVLLDKNAEPAAPVETKVVHVLDDGTEETLGASLSATDEGYVFRFSTGSFSTFTLYRVGTNSNERFTTTVKYSRFSGASKELTGTTAVNNNDQSGWMSFDDVIALWDSSYGYAGSNGRYSVLRANDSGGSTKQALCAIGFFETRILLIEAHVTLGRFATESSVNGSATNYDLQIELNDNSLPVKISVDGAAPLDTVFVPADSTLNFTPDEICSLLGYGEDEYELVSSKLNSVSVDSIARVQLTETDVPTVSSGSGWWSKLLAGNSFSYGAGSALIVGNAVSYGETNVSYPAAYKWNYDNNGTTATVGDTPLVLELRSKHTVTVSCEVTDPDAASDNPSFAYTYSIVSNGIETADYPAKTDVPFTLQNGDTYEIVLLDGQSVSVTQTANAKYITKTSVNGGAAEAALTGSIQPVSADGTIDFINSISIARVSNDGGMTWSNHEYLINSSGTGSEQGAFDLANTLTGEVIVELLFETHERYTLAQTFRFDNASISSLTLRTTTDATLNPDDFTSVLLKNQTAAPMISTAGVNSLSVENLILNGDDKLTTNNHGGILSTDAKQLTLTDCTFIKGQAGRMGGGVYHNNAEGTAVVTGCTFTSCKANGPDDSAGGGGGGLVSNAFSLTVSNCTFDDCKTAKRQAAGLFHKRVNSDSADSSTTIADCSFNNCVAYHGGAAESDAWNVTVSDCTFTNCSGTGSGNGGALNVYADGVENTAENTTLTVTGCTFTNCSTNKAGGAIRSTALNNTVSDCEFVNCMSGASGGAIACTNSHASSVFTHISDCTFTDCTAKVFGGAINARNLTVDGDSSITGCTAKQGGAIYARTISLTDGSITDNTTTDESAAVHATASKNPSGYTFSGSPVIKNNVGASDEARNVYLWSDTDQSIEIIGTLGDESEIGVYVADTYFDKYGDPGDPFGKKPADVTENLDAFFSDRDVRLFGAKGADATKIYWGNYICKIEDSSGEHPFATLNAALNYARSNLGGTATIEMLVDYVVPSSDKVTLNGDTDNITITTAATEGGVYNFAPTFTEEEGRLGTDSTSIAILQRGWNGGATEAQAMFYINNISAVLTTENIILDGKSKIDSETTVIQKTGRAIYVKSGSFGVDGFTTFRNFDVSDGNGAAVYAVNELTFIFSDSANILFDNCTAKKGGAIYANSALNITSNGGSLSFNSCIVSDAGGGIYANGDMTIAGADKLSFTGCKANYGGGIYQNGTGNMMLSNITFGESGNTDKGCFAEIEGGSVWSKAINTAIIDCNFYYSRAGSGANGNNTHGGAVLFSGAASDNQVLGCVFDHCSVHTTSTQRGHGNGGAVYASENVLKMTIDQSSTRRSSFTNCSAYRYGGAVILEQNGDCTLIVQNSDFENCYTTYRDGGAVYSDSDTTLFEDCTFTGCHSDSSSGEFDGGGAIYMNGDTPSISSNIQINNCQFDDCYVKKNGGAIHFYSTATNATLTDVTITGHKSLAESSANAALGSAIFSRGNVTIIDSEIKGCSASGAKGGAINLTSGKSVSFEGNVVVTGNTNTTTDKNHEHNVVLEYNTYSMIRTTVTGLGENAEVGVYVTDTDTAGSQTNPYLVYGGPGDRFGIYAQNGSIENFDKFINDRNGLHGELDDVSLRTIRWEITIKIHEGKIFRDFEDQENPKISLDSAFTFQTPVSGANARLKFTSTSGSTVRAPAGTTVILRDISAAQPTYYYTVLTADASEIALNSFSKMGGTGTAPVNFTAQFIVDFSQTSGMPTSGLSVTENGETKNILCVGIGYGSAAPESSGRVELKAPANFTLGENTVDTDLTETLSVDSNAGPRVNNGRATIWDNREMALVFEPQDGMPLPPDATLQVTIGSGAVQSLEKNAGGVFILPLGDFGPYSPINVTLNSDNFPAAATEYKMNAKLMVSDTLREQSPYGGLTAKIQELVFKSDAQAMPSIKISSAKRSYRPGETVTFSVKTLNDMPYEVTLTVYQKIESTWTNPTVVQSEQTVKSASAGDGTFTTVTFPIPSAGTFDISYKAVVTVKNGADVILEVPYYFLAVDPNSAA